MAGGEHDRSDRGWPDPARLPAGVVTLMFTDIEGSTRLLAELGDDYAVVQEAHFELLGSAITDAGGVVVDTEGDGFFAAFRDPTRAIDSAIDAQRRIAEYAWPHGEPLRIRVGIHTGQVAIVARRYLGIDVNIAARIARSGHGGQVVVSAATNSRIQRDLPSGVTIKDLGEHRLKDIRRPMRLYQLSIAGLRTDFPPLRTLPATQTNLRPDRTSFVGRNTELMALGETLGQARLVTLVGAGGSGKTRLMLQASASLLDRADDGVWLVELAPIRDPALVVSQVGQTLGVVEEPGRSALSGLIDYLTPKSLVLLLDNCEHVVDAVADVVEKLLDRAQGLTVVATSREAIGVDGEALFQVGALSLPAPVDPDHLRPTPTDSRWDAVAASDAVQLFVDRARAVMPTFELTATNVAPIVAVCRALDGNPLAIELAAARLRVMSIDEIATGLTDRFRLLRTSRRTAPSRQRSLRELVDWSWDLLDPADRTLLARLSVFSGGCTIDAAVAVTSPADDSPDATLDGITRLVDRSLVVVDRAAGGTRYTMLETIRLYGLDRLRDESDATATQSRHAHHFARLVHETEASLLGPRMTESVRRLDSELGNVRTALDHAFRDDLAMALAMCVALRHYWDVRAGTEAIDTLRRAADVAPSLLSGADPAARSERSRLVARTLAAAAAAHSAWGEPGPALGWAAVSVRLARASGDRQALAEALAAQMLAMIFSGTREGVDDVRDEALRAAHAVDDPWLITLIQSGSAEGEFFAGRPDRAQERLASATDAAMRSGNPYAIGFIALRRGISSGYMGQVDEARGWFAEALTRYEELGDRRFVLITRSDLAHALRRNGVFEEARALYDETITEWMHSGNRGAVAAQLEALAYLARAQGAPERAARLAGAAGSLREVSGAAMPPHERREYDSELELIQHELTPEAFRVAFEVGRHVDVEAAVALGLSEPPTQGAIPAVKPPAGGSLSA